VGRSTTGKLADGATAGLGVGVSLADDDTLMIHIEQEELDVIDNEMFEPLNTLDDEMREICIDIVNEKVRRILAVDPSKFKGGKLPFGLRADTLGDDAQRLIKLEGELDQIKIDLRDMTDDRDSLRQQLEAAKRGIETLKAERGKPVPQEQERKPKEPPPLEMAPTPSSAGGRRKPEGNGGQHSDEEMEAAVTKAKQELQAKMASVEKELLMMKKAEAEAKEKLAKSQQEVEDLKKELAKLKMALEDAQKKLRAATGKKDPPPPPPAEVIVQESSKEVDFGQAAKARLEQELQASQGELKRCKTSTRQNADEYKKVLEKFARLEGDKDSGKSKVDMAVKGSLDDIEEYSKNAQKALTEWSDEIHGYLKKDLQDAQAAANKKPVVKREAGEKVIEEKTIEVIKADPKDAEEIARLTQISQKQQEEIARLLLTIDELRARIEAVKDISVEAPPEEQKVIIKTMQKAGLREIMEVRNGPKLKGVFERLYQDAIQRHQRLDLIRERMLLANKAYSTIVNAIASKGDEAGLADAIPDLDRLTSTAAAMLDGMWYNTDFLFRNTCEYAIAQGVESSIMKPHKQSLHEVLEAGADYEGVDPGDDDPNSPNYKLRKRAGGSGGDRLPGRRGGERIISGKNLPGATTSGDARAFWHPLPGGISHPSSRGPKSPRSDRKGHLADPEPSSFSSYIAALREARGDLKSDEWNRVPLPERKLIPKGEGVEFYPKTLKASVAAGGTRSLPVLPKGRGGMIQQTQQAVVGGPSSETSDFSRSQ
jgi:hypothetical protein